MADPHKQLPELVARLYEVVDALEALYEGRSFAPDGHLVRQGQKSGQRQVGMGQAPGLSEGVAPADRLEFAAAAADLGTDPIELT